MIGLLHEQERRIGNGIDGKLSIMSNSSEKEEGL